MSTGTDISALCREFTDALTEVFAENAVGPARRGRLARARAAVKKHLIRISNKKSTREWTLTTVNENGEQAAAMVPLTTPNDY
jgi:hypothetical protein